MKTSFEDRCTILSELWLNFRDDELFEDFITFHDIALPLAHVISEEIVDSTDKAANYVNECFELLLKNLGFENDSGFESIDEILELADN